MTTLRETIFRKRRIQDALWELRWRIPIEFGRWDAGGSYVEAPQRLIGLACRSSDHEPYSYRWFEAEAARIVLRVLHDDAMGAGTLPLVSDDPTVIQAEVWSRARSHIPTWVKEL